MMPASSHSDNAPRSRGPGSGRHANGGAAAQQASGSYGRVFGAAPQERFGRFARLAARLLGAPMAQFAFVGEEQPQVLATHGADLSRQRLFLERWCAQVLGAEGVTVIEDAAEDARADGIALPTEDAPLRFCAGVPLVAPDNDRRPLGVLSVFDVEPRSLTGEDRRALADLAGAAADALAFRRATAAPAQRVEQTHQPKREEHPFTDALIDSLPGIFYLFDLEGNILRWNDQFEMLTGYTSEEIRRMGPLDFIAPEAHEETRQILAKLVHTGQAAAEVPFQTKDGRRLPLLCTGRRVVLNGQPRLVGVGTDLSEHRRAEEALRASGRRTRQLFNRANVPVMIFRPEQERILEANPAACHLYGFAREDLLGRSLQDLTEDVERGRREVRQILEHGGTRNFETVHRDRDGARLHLLASCSLIEYDDEQAVLLFERNITERKHAEAQTQELKSFYENILDELPPEIVVLDAEGRFRYLNRTAVDDPELRAWLIGKTDLDYARRRGRDPEPFRKRHEWVLSLIEDQKAGRREESFRTEAGQRRHHLRVAVPVLDAAGEVDYLIVYSIDLTERKKHEVALIEAKEEAEEMARFKSAFLANISHEVRTPLSTIAGFADVLAEEAEQGHHREFARTIERASTRLDATLTSVLDLARLEADELALELRPVDVTAQLEDDLRLFAAQAEKKGLAFEIETPGVPVRAAVDEVVLSRVLANLTSNALKFTDEGRVSVRVSARDGKAHIEVQDTGAGIDEAFLPDLFEDFTQESQHSSTGSGLGLSITKRLVELMDGRIEVESRKGAGTTFTLTFPLAQGEELGV